MKKCFGRTKSFKRCKIDCNSLLCHHHKSQWWLVFIFSLIFIWKIIEAIATVAGVNADTPHLVNSVENLFGVNSQEKIICDRDLDTGCVIDFNRPIYIYSENKNYAYLSLKISYGKSHQYLSGGPKSIEDTIDFITVNDDPSTYSYFPFAFDSLLSPYSVKLTDTLLLFFGRINDYKTNDLLGWFDENEFGIVKPCSFSWNKDDRGIEIIDKYNQVCFSIDYDVKNYHLKYKGFFKTDNVFHIYNDTTYNQTIDLKEAEKLIAQIQPNFDHFGKNSTGKRLRKVSR